MYVCTYMCNVPPIQMGIVHIQTTECAKGTVIKSSVTRNSLTVEPYMYILYIHVQVGVCEKYKCSTISSHTIPRMR